MKKTLCFLLVVLLMCPFHILAAEVDIFAPVTPPPEEGEAAPEAAPAETDEASPDAAQPEEGETVPETPPAETAEESPNPVPPTDPALPTADQLETPADPALPEVSEPAPADSPAEADETSPEPAPEDGTEAAQPEPEPSEEEEDPTVQMRVSPTGQIIINPYGYSVSTNLGTTNEQIISTTQYLVSQSDVPISVSVEIVGTHSNPDARFVSAQPDPSAKELFLYAEFQPVTEGQDPVWLDAYTGADCQVLINETKDNVITLPSGDGTPRKVAFRLFGAVSSGPESGWTGSDSLSVTMSYEFNPIKEEAEPAEEETPETQDGTEASEAVETLEPKEEEPVLPSEDQPETTEPERKEDLPAEPETPEEPDEAETPLPEDEPVETETVSPPDRRHPETEHDSDSSWKDEKTDTIEVDEKGISWLAPAEKPRTSENSNEAEAASPSEPVREPEEDDSGVWFVPGETEEAEQPQSEEPDDDSETDHSGDTAGTEPTENGASDNGVWFTP